MRLIFFDPILSALVIITATLAVISIVSNFVSDHQWMLLIFDATCVVLLTMAIRYRLDRNFQTPKGKWLFWLLFYNVLILIIQSFGAVWNFAVMLFILWPLAIGISQLIEKPFKEFFWWLVDYSGSVTVIVCVYSVILAVLSGKEILMPGLLSDILMLLAAALLVLVAVLITIYMFFNKKRRIK
jgi:hypothetical protein